VARPARPVSLGLVLACLAGTLALGGVLKAPCASGHWDDGRQYERLCYSDVVPLLGTEQLTGGRLPFLDPCDTRSTYQCDEYPVISMWTMRAAAWVSGADVARFFWANAVILSLAAAVVAIAVYVMAGRRALWVALAPTLLIYAFVNWDLVAVAFATVATLAFLRRRDVWSGVLIGLGAAAKLYPALLLVPFVAARFRSQEPARGTYLAWAAIGSWLVVNLPFALAAPGGWWEFFRFNGRRPADWDSIWFIACHRATGEYSCGHTALINIASAVVFVALFAVLWRWKATRDPGFARWTLGFPAIVLFLLTSKVYSPQYGLWLLPWFALILPGVRLFVAFEIADVLVFVTRFSWFSELAGFGGIPLGLFEIAVVARAVVLVLCVGAWLRARDVVPEPLELEEPPPAAVPAAAPA